MSNPQAGLAPPIDQPTITCNYEKLSEFEFTPPPECPVFYPTKEEFQLGPIDYINKIRSQAEPCGICKIIPPKDFLVPFAVDVNEFHFTPRSQRLNELEALTRIKLNFYDRINKFWDLQGVTLRIPTVEKRLLDLYTLHTIVKEEGGFEICTRDRKWAKITNRMNYTKSSASTFRTYYEKFLFPYDVFLSGATIGPEIKEERKNGDSNHTDEEEKEEEDGNGEVNNSELKKLQVYGAGPRMPGIISDPASCKGRCCFHCTEPVQFSSQLTCSKCEYSFHKHCLFPPFNELPKGNWHCHRCLSQLINTLPQLYTSEFGFAQSTRTYTLFEFGEMADNFKAKYFNAKEVSCLLLEKEFWRIVSTVYESNVCVEYGADLHTNDYGSGFPTASSQNFDEIDKKYVTSPWNLNNLPTTTGSIFKHISTNIDGMIIPWMYVGMCFSSFCWHNEDHWTYSINYLHWGEPKTWYGVPGDKAEIFEDAMRKLAPDLFHSQPDLLHHLVTTCNPNILSQFNVPIYRTNQRAGEFVVTFPRSYHSGFNQGFNFAEAVNFATSDWLPIGRLSIAHYASLHRYPVFSHDELVCKMADEASDLEIRLSMATLEDLSKMIEYEKELRINASLVGILNTDRLDFSRFEDDERQCIHCYTTCFLSAVICSCSKSKSEKLVCLNHLDRLCKTCSFGECTLIYRYTLDELKIMQINLRKHVSENGMSKKVEPVGKVTRRKQVLLF